MKKGYAGKLQGAVLVLAVLLMGVTSPVLAHEIEILRSNPADGSVMAAAPALVQVWFGSELAVDGSYLQVYDASSTQVDLKNGGLDLEDATHTSMKVGLPEGLPDGIYVARWQATLPDGDAVLGTFQFTVSAAPYPAAVQPNPVQTTASYPVESPGGVTGGKDNFLNKIFRDRNSLIGAGIGGLAVLLGILVLVKKLTSNRN